MTSATRTDDEFHRAAGAALARDLKRANRVCAAVALASTLVLTLVVTVALG